ncbi:LINE-1 retrotransposable element ORF2 protein [Acipenser ruthenus]|uniref:ribonuclease H n=1 Tax=Acipenser ruthenus TaxID=7906 RepID=A0A444UDN2_ACIRT|nr:LINE-1 retrotransposable element ORF2 protein [Acipenser ruthenus]
MIVPILKKGDNRECKNYRGISLLSITGKAFMKIIQSRLQKHREQTSREEQAGFRPNRGCCDQIFAIRQLMEERIRCGKRTIIVFIDFKSAFDCVHWPALWRALETEHVLDKITRLLKMSYDGLTSCVRIWNELSEEFPIQTRVCQGDVASPLLFNTVIDAVMRKAFEGRRGVQCDENTYVTVLMFADDSAIFTDTDAEATDILYSIVRVAEPYGIKINADKTTVLTTDESPANVHLDGAQIEQVQEFKYLGSVVQEKKVASSTDVHGRIGQAIAAFVSLKWCLWKRANISVKTKIRLFRTLILPILLYGSETWTLLK